MSSSEESPSSVKGKELASRFQSLIKVSKQICQGPPATYLLNTFKENLNENGRVRKCTFGTKSPSKMTRTVMMVGETGTGKSALINAMVNYILGVEWEDNIQFQITEERTGSRTESQTTAITVYEIYGQEGDRVPFSLRFIDTPGYGDTRGKQEDKRIAENMLKLFRSENGVQKIDAICLVVKSSQNRLTDFQRYIFDAILSLFGKDVKNNIMALITFHPRGTPEALEAIIQAGVPCARNEKNQPVHFKFDNVSWKDDDDDDEEDMQRNWAKGVKTMRRFFKYLNTMEVRSVQMTLEVLEERIQLEARVQNLQERIREAEGKQKKIRQTQAAVEKYKEDMHANKDFTYEVEEQYKEQVETTDLATSCKKCKTTCHYPCTFILFGWLRWCAVMSEGKCTVCPGQCSSGDHVKEKKRYELKTCTVTKTSEELKKKYEKAMGEKATAEVLIHWLITDLRITEAKKTKLLEELYQSVVKLDKIALRPESMSTLKHIDFLITKIRETGNAERVQKLEDMKSRAEAVLGKKEGLSVTEKVTGFIPNLMKAKQETEKPS